MHACTFLSDLYSRCDQYRWLHGEAYYIKLGDMRITKKSSSIDLEGNKNKTGDPRCQRFEYWDVEHTMFYITLVTTPS